MYQVGFVHQHQVFATEIYFIMTLLSKFLLEKM